MTIDYRAKILWKTALNLSKSRKLAYIGSVSVIVLILVTVANGIMAKNTFEARDSFQPIFEQTIVSGKTPENNSITAKVGESFKSKSNDSNTPTATHTPAQSDNFGTSSTVNDKSNNNPNSTVNQSENKDSTTIPTLVPTSVPTTTPTPSVTPKPTPTSATSSAPTSTPKPTVTPIPTESLKPDLIITGANLMDPPMKQGNWNYILVDIKNQGSSRNLRMSNIKASISVTGGGTTDCEAGLEVLNPGDSYTATLNCIVYSSGMATASITVDYNNAITESNEGNNNYSYNISVTP